MSSVLLIVKTAESQTVNAYAIVVDLRIFEENSSFQFLRCDFLKQYVVQKCVLFYWIIARLTVNNTNTIVLYVQLLLGCFFSYVSVSSTGSGSVGGVGGVSAVGGVGGVGGALYGQNVVMGSWCGPYDALQRPPAYGKRHKPKA